MQLGRRVAPEVGERQAGQAPSAAPRRRGAARSAMEPILGGGADRHDDVDVVVLADAADDAGRQRAGQLERRLVGPEVAEHVDEVARVEGDGRRRALDRASTVSALSPTSAACAVIATPAPSASSPPSSIFTMFALSRAKMLARRVPARNASRSMTARELCEAGMTGS